MSLPTIDGVEYRPGPPSEMVRRFGDQFAELERAKELLESCRAQNENLIVRNVKLSSRVEALLALLSDVRASMRSDLDSMDRMLKEAKESWR